MLKETHFPRRTGWQVGGFPPPFFFRRTENA